MKHIILIVKKRNVLADYWSRIFIESGHHVVISNIDYETAWQTIQAYTPTILLIEATFADDRGFDLARQARQDYPALRCIVCLPDTPYYYAQAILTDISGYLPDDLDDPQEMLTCLEQISQGYRYISRAFQMALNLPSNQYKSAIEALSERHRQILKLLAKGYTSRQIALELQLAEPTVRHHKEQIAQSLGLQGVYMLKLFVGSIAHLLD